MPSAEVVSTVRAAVQRVLGQMLQDGHTLSDDQPLMEAGLDSLGAVELRSELAAAFDLDVPATLTFDYPSIAALGAYFSSRLQAAQLGA